jgi:hypothetical protein
MKKKLNKCYACKGVGKIDAGDLIIQIGPFKVFKDKTIECPICSDQKEIRMIKDKFDEIEKTIH